MVVVAIQNMLAGASSYASLVFCIPVEVVGLSVGESSDALLAGRRRSVVCHFYKSKIYRSECKEDKRNSQALEVYTLGCRMDNFVASAPPALHYESPTTRRKITLGSKRL